VEIVANTHANYAPQQVNLRLTMGWISLHGQGFFSFPFHVSLLKSFLPVPLLRKSFSDSSTCKCKFYRHKRKL